MSTDSEQFTAEFQKLLVAEKLKQGEARCLQVKNEDTNLFYF